MQIPCMILSMDVLEVNVIVPPPPGGEWMQYCILNNNFFGFNSRVIYFDLICSNSCQKEKLCQDSLAPATNVWKCFPH